MQDDIARDRMDLEQILQRRNAPSIQQSIDMSKTAFKINRENKKMQVTKDQAKKAIENYLLQTTEDIEGICYKSAKLVVGVLINDGEIIKEIRNMIAVFMTQGESLEITE